MLISCACCLLHNRHCVPKTHFPVLAASCIFGAVYQKRTFLCLLPPDYSALCTKNILSCVFCLLHNRHSVPTLLFLVWCLLHNRHSVPNAVVPVFAASCIIGTLFQTLLFLCLLPPAQSALCTKMLISCVCCLLPTRHC